jgi:hypothetical protein
MEVSKQEIARVFKENPSLNQVHFTSDGLAFIYLNDAKGHAIKQEDKTVVTVDRPVVSPEATKKKASEVIAEIQSIENKEAFDSYELAKGEDRATVLEAYEAKKKEFDTKQNAD